MAVLPPPSILRAPGGIEMFEAGPTAKIFRPSMTIVPCSTGAPPLPSTMRMLVTAMDCALAKVLNIPAAPRANRSRMAASPIIQSKVRFIPAYLFPRLRYSSSALTGTAANAAAATREIIHLVVYGFVILEPP